MDEKYFRVEKKSDKYNSQEFPDVLKLGNLGLEILTFKDQSKIMDFGFQEKNGEYFVNSDYIMKEISRKDSEIILEKRNRDRKMWEVFSSGTDSNSFSRFGSKGGFEI